MWAVLAFGGCTHHGHAKGRRPLEVEIGEGKILGWQVDNLRHQYQMISQRAKEVFKQRAADTAPAMGCGAERATAILWDVLDVILQYH